MTDAPTIFLPARQLFEVPDPADLRIACTAGCLWLTLDGDLRDVVLEPGASFEAPQRRRVLLYAMEPSAFVLEAAPRRVRRPGSPKGDPADHRAAVVWSAIRVARPA